MENKLYLIPCNPDNHTYISKLLNESVISSKMNNYDGTFDYIIKCTQEFALSLEQKGVNIIADRKIVFNLQV